MMMAAFGRKELAGACYSLMRCLFGSQNYDARKRKRRSHNYDEVFTGNNTFRL